MKLLIFQKGFQYARDGTGNRLVYHLQGCNMHCPWCANPEGIPIDPVLIQKTDIIPVWICGNGAVSADGGFDRLKCADCKEKSCFGKPNASLVPSSRFYETDELAAEAESCKPMFFGGGGVTLTGGEVCVQARAAEELLRKLKLRGIHTLFETNASLKTLPDLLPYLDEVIADYKHADADILMRETGGNLRTIEDNLKEVLRSGLPLHLRIPLVHGFNDGERDIRAVTDALKRLYEYGKFDIEFLPYHEYGKNKWRSCGMEYKMKDGFVPPERVSEITEQFIKAGFLVVKT